MSSIYVPVNLNASVDLTNYYTKSQTNTLLSNYLPVGTDALISGNTGSFNSIEVSGTGAFRGDIFLSGKLKNSDGSIYISLPSNTGTMALTSDIADLAIQEPMGFLNRTDSKINFDDAKLQFTIEPSSTSFSYYHKGTKYTKSSPETIPITDTEGIWYFYYNGATLISSQTAWSITDHVPISFVYWDATNNVQLLMAEERHGCIMDTQTHLYLHRTIGARYASGFTLSGSITGTGSLDADAQIDLSGGTIFDEDIQIDTSRPYDSGTVFSQNLALPAQIPVYYLSGSSAWRKVATNNFPVYFSTLLNYNLLNITWSATPATNNYFVASWIVATNNRQEPIICILGQRQDSSLANAQTNNTVNSISFGNFPFAEMKIIYRLIYQTGSTYNNAVKARLRDIQDLRNSSSIPNGVYTSNQHSSLGGLTDPNSHPATAISLNTGTFGNLLTLNETDAQSAFNKIDTIGDTFNTNKIISNSGSIEYLNVGHTGNFEHIETKSVNINNALFKQNSNSAVQPMFILTSNDGEENSAGIYAFGDRFEMYYRPYTNTINTPLTQATIADAATRKADLTVKNINCSTGTLGNLVSSNTADAVSSSNAPNTFSGGVGIAKKLYVSGGLYSTLDLTLQATAGITFPSGSAIGMNNLGQMTFKSTALTSDQWYIRANSNGGGTNIFAIVNNLAGTPSARFYGTGDASSSTSGGVIMSGGLAVAKKVYIGDALYLPTSGGTPSGLSYYEEYTHTVSITGAFETSNVDIGVVRVGKITTINFPSITIQATASDTVNISTALPSRFRPSSLKTFIVPIQSGTTIYSGSLDVLSDGTMKVYRDVSGASFSSGSISGIISTSLSFSV